MKILVIYANLTPQMRQTQQDHLYCFQQYHPAYYLNIHFHPVRPRQLQGMGFECVLLHTTFLATHWSGRDKFRAAIDKLAFLADWSVPKIAMPQDEYINTDLIVACINTLKVQMVLSVAPASEWPQIYQGVDFAQVRFERILTGYINPEAVPPAPSNSAPRPIDIGYRARDVPFSLGRHGQLKVRIGDMFTELGAQYHLKTDISKRAEDTLLGLEWHRFLSTCKYTLGVEGGVSIHDRDGSLFAGTEAYIKAQQQLGHCVDYAEAERVCFPNRDGEIKLVALSPRHLEACITKTCQILIEGDYNGILIPHRHYIPVKSDFSNLDEVMQLLQNETMRLQLVENAYRDIVQSGKYTYACFVEWVVQQINYFQNNEQPPSSFALWAHIQFWIEAKMAAFKMKLRYDLKQKWKKKMSEFRYSW